MARQTIITYKWQGEDRSREDLSSLNGSLLHNWLSILVLSERLTQRPTFQSIYIWTLSKSKVAYMMSSNVIVSIRLFFRGLKRRFKHRTWLFWHLLVIFATLFSQESKNYLSESAPYSAVYWQTYGGLWNRNRCQSYSDSLRIRTPWRTVIHHISSNHKVSKRAISRTWGVSALSL